ncbi:hypothetical protein PO365_19935 [Klebsiella variicola]|uniref:hypothetical protein n=2 Tax=Klebsiella pneumoniae complex TaxID=3390273 RepID=UPI002FF7BED4
MMTLIWSHCAGPATARKQQQREPDEKFKIEYVDGVLTVLETDGQSRMNEAVHGIHFEHVQGGRPLLKLTIAHDIAPAPAAESAQEPLVGELVQDQQSPFPGGRRSRHRRGGKQ